MISFSCPSCSCNIKVKDELAGRKGKCPGCKQAVTVPGAPVAVGGSQTELATLPPKNRPESQSESATLAPGSRHGSDTGIGPNSPIQASSSELTDFLAPPQAPDEIGRLGPYRVLKVLGAGGMGVVYLAEDPRLQRQVALKAMLPALAASASNRERFLREARAAAALEHDHVVPIYVVDEERKVPFIAMPFLKGESLEDRLKKQKQLSLAETLRIGRETAEGLSAAHARGLIHRDIKPANIWLEGDRSRVKILDFGLARSSSGDSQLTQQGAIVGTPAFMAPEQASGTVDGRADLFSLGCVLYRTITGQLPFKGNDTVTTLIAVAMEEPPAPATVRSSIPVAVSDLIMQLLEKKKVDRPASARKVVEQLAALEEDPGPTETIPSGKRDKKSDVVTTKAMEGVRPKRRRRAKRPGVPIHWIAAGAGGLVAVGLLAAFFLWPKAKPAAIASAPDATRPPETGKTTQPAPVTLPPAVEPPVENPKPPDPQPDPPVQQTAEVPGEIDNDPIAIPKRESVPGGKEAMDNRRAAEIVLKLGGTIRLSDSSNSALFRRATDELPAGPFWLTEISFGDDSGRRVTDAGLKPLQGLFLRALDTVSFWECRAIRGEGCVFLAGAPNLKLFNIGNSTVAPATFRFLVPCKNLGVVHALGSRTSDVGLEYLKDLTQINTIHLSNTPITPQGVKHLANLRKVTSLQLNTQMSDVALFHIKDMTSLDDLFIGGPQVTDAGMPYLSKMTKLTKLYLEHVPITNAGLATVGTLPALRELHLSKAKITDEGFVHLKQLAQLTQLNLSQLQINGSGFKHLAELKNLNYLLIAEAPITDASLESLQRIPTLNELHLRQTLLTKAAVERFKKAVPSCNVTIYGSLRSP